MEDTSIKTIKISILPILFLVFTFGIFIPSSLFFGNIDEFSVSYSRIIPIMLVVSAIMLAVLFLLAFLFLRIEEFFAAFVFGGGLAIYIQSNFLNWSLPEMNGAEVNWESFTFPIIISSAVWLLCLLAPLIFVDKKTKQTIKVINIASAFLIAVQLITLITMMLTTSRSAERSFALTRNQEFELSSQNNTIVFVVDTLDGQWMDEFLETDPDAKKGLEGFTYFDNAVSGGAPTILGIPAMLTGTVYDRSESLHSYYENSYENSTFFKDLKDRGYDVRVYTEIKYMDGADGSLFSNAVTDIEYEIPDNFAFAKRLYRLSLVYAVPQDMKELFWFYGDDLSMLISAKDIDTPVFTLDDPLFFKELNEQGIRKTGSEGTFVFYHLLGAHGPYTMDADSNFVGEAHSNRQLQIKGSFNIIFKYMEMLEAQGLLDSSTIIITADHGGVDFYQNPAILIKRPGDTGDLKIDHSPVTFKNLYATFVNETGGKAEGADLFQVDEDDISLRYHTLDSHLAEVFFPTDEDVMSSDYVTVSVGEEARDRNAIYLIHNKDFVNRLELTTGEEYAFNQEDGKAYASLGAAEEPGRWVIGESVEFLINVKDYEGGPLNLRIDHSRVLNESQRMEVYLGEKYLGDFICSSGEGSVIFTVGEEDIKDGNIAVTLKFPDAVRPNDLDPSKADYRRLSITLKSMCLIK